MKTTDHWLEIRWLLAKPAADAFVALHDQIGALGSFVYLDLDPAQEAAKTHTTLISYFPDQAEPQNFAESLKKWQSTDAQLTEVRRIPYGDWATAWKQYFHPFALTPDIVICPSWESYAAKPHEHVVTLDPGMAFGTGQHDTTKFCAEFLCDLKRDHKVITRVLDVGCGSGILSLIAATLGAREVLGVDVEDAAIDTSNENLQRNPQLKGVTFGKTDGTLTDACRDTFDVVAANIIAESLCELQATLTQLVAPGGYLILSGILPVRGAMVKAAFQNLKFVAERTSETWHTYLYQR